MRFPATIFEFQEQFPSETACWQYLGRLRWPRGFLCPRCGHDRSYFLERRRLEQCTPCRSQASGLSARVQPCHRSSRLGCREPRPQRVLAAPSNRWIARIHPGVPAYRRETFGAATGNPLSA